ncbi:hypothetical protein [Cryptosporangium arvum]|uniref:hypothetical protein n=1 Tax=Cryptosporangium arvum TaxID=80871 RepID=UPI0005619E73|nr:hypothetical protein [Cryptosporangium arvum]
MPPVRGWTARLTSVAAWRTSLVGREAEHSARLVPARYEPNPKRCIDDLDVRLGDRVFPVADLVASAFRRPPRPSGG